ncbi:MAG: M12 family metallopeptidase [Gammaproteobacteria bacterium]|nr:M12 family metallopeptidase [Gammaproteobacteria bacterium]MCH9716058.1 M12 family metallopeptidase [Gammaproteobacteria bacterium]MCH9763084.1 M12 family metallopeptidase [Gammaproteobacteria bacterium]
MKKIGMLLWGFFWLGTGFADMCEQGMVIEPEGARWLAGVVPYVIDDAFSLERQTEILDAMVVWEKDTTVRFVARTAENQDNYPDYVLFKSQTGRTCASSVGRQGGIQTLHLAPRCHTMMIAHELGHVLGLWHEQARLDRDIYIDVHWENIEEEHFYNFSRRVGEGKNQGIYDYDSIMHYSESAFSKNGKATLVPRVSGFKIGQRTHLSAGDIAAVNALYFSKPNE